MVTAIKYSSEYSENVMLQTNCSNTVNRPRYLNSATPRHHRRAWAIEACLIASLPVTFAVGWSVREKWSVLAWSSSTHPLIVRCRHRRRDTRRIIYIRRGCSDTESRIKNIHLKDQKRCFKKRFRN